MRFLDVFHSAHTVLTVFFFLCRCPRSQLTLTVQSLKSKWMLKKNWWSSLPFPDSATLTRILFLPSRSLYVTSASSPSSPPFIKASWSLCFLAMPLTATKTETMWDCTQWLSFSVLNNGLVTDGHPGQWKADGPLGCDLIFTTTRPPL